MHTIMQPTKPLSHLQTQNSPSTVFLLYLQHALPQTKQILLQPTPGVVIKFKQNILHCIILNILFLLDTAFNRLQVTTLTHVQKQKNDTSLPPGGLNRLLVKFKPNVTQSSQG